MKYIPFLFLVIILYPVGAFAAEYVPMVGIPGIENATDLKLNNYINALYILSISIAAFLAVIKLMYAGIQYIFSDIITNKENAKKDIRNALIGLLIVIGAVMILNTINPELKDLDALGKIEPSRTSLQAISVPIKTGFTTTFGTEVLGSSLNWDTASDSEKKNFSSSCTGDVVLTKKSNGVNIGTCTISADAPVDPDLIETSIFVKVDDNVLSRFELRNSLISNEIGTTVYSGDVRGLLIIENIPEDDEIAFGISLQPKCEREGGSHVAHTYYGGKHEFWCVGKSGS